ncbi:MAG TPA: DMT family transporter [Actinomycetota bacterium]|nr:DMT family transporter [Actinomycetota bacterium]
MHRERLSGYAAMSVAATAWGVIPVIVRKAGAPPAVLVSMRMGFGALALAAVASGLRHRVFPRTSRRLLGVLGVVLAANWLMFFTSIGLIGAAAVLINYAFPLLVAVAAPVVLAERREAHAVPLALAGLAGLALILVPRASSGDALGAGLALAAAVLTAVIVMGGSRVVRTVPGSVAALWQNATGFVVLLPFALRAGTGSYPWAWGLVLGVGLTALTGMLFFHALERIPAQEAGILMFMEPVAAVAFVWLFGGDRPSLADLAGGAVVVGAGVALVVLSGRRPREPV